MEKRMYEGERERERERERELNKLPVTTAKSDLSLYK